VTYACYIDDVPVAAVEWTLCHRWAACCSWSLPCWGWWQGHNGASPQRWLTYL